MSEDTDQDYAVFLRFTDIFDSSSPNSAEVLSILTSNPTTGCAEALATSVLNAVEKHPEAVDALVSSVHVVLDSIDAIPVDDYWHRPVYLHTVVMDHLVEFVKDSLGETHYEIPKQTTISPSNTTLAVALFSSSAMKSGLVNDEITSIPYHFIRQGLQLPDSGFDSLGQVERQETLGIGACLHLTVAGASVTQAFPPHEKELALEALKELKEKHVISHPGGIALLEDAIANAESAYTRDMPTLQAWRQLFPETVQSIS
ncbi:hypothetical protein Hypma_012938 [Hypsizygus marmoreus]|uniref:Uncharacterized protein n=1 Tax=Hypsizygus marmoreus TaxID=39966 RepID=A0A369JHZ6_HYPMA|nr:hypothetical protein Hypma_012938 [Hypsizygus marmoreus]